MPRQAAAILLAAAALAAAGCGAQPSSAGDFQGEERAVAQAVEDLQAAGERDESARICRDLLARELRDRMAAEGSTCEKEIAKAVDDADVFELEVTGVTVQGTTATARVKSRRGTADAVETLRLAKEGGRWRTAAFGG